MIVKANNCRYNSGVSRISARGVLKVRSDTRRGGGVLSVSGPIRKAGGMIAYREARDIVYSSSIRVSIGSASVQLLLQVNKNILYEKVGGI